MSDRAVRGKANTARLRFLAAAQGKYADVRVLLDAGGRKAMTGSIAARRKTALKSSFAHAVIFFASFLTLIHVSSPLRAADATSDPAGFDVLRMKPGMSVVEIETAIKANNPAFTIGITRLATGEALGVGKFIPFVTGKRQIANGLHEYILVGFTVTEPHRAFSISRRTSFLPGEEPLKDKLLQQLREKYGQDLSSNTWRTGYYWLFDKAGKQPIRTAREITATPYLCAPVQGFAYGINTQILESQINVGMVDLNLRPKLDFSSKCSVELHVELGQSSSNPHLLSMLSEELVGDSIAVDDIQKLMAEAKAERERQLQQRQQQEQKASGVKAPL